MNKRSTVVASLVAAAGMLIGPATAFADGGGQWPSAGGTQANTRNQTSGNKITPSTVGGLEVKWSFTTGGDVSATPSVDGDTVYFPDWSGNLYAVDKETGAQRWRSSIAAATGTPGDKARNTPAIADGKVVVGTQGLGAGAKVIAFDKTTGATSWTTTLDSHPAAIVTQSATIKGDTVYIGTASQEELLAAVVAGYPCCSFRGALYAVDLYTGAIKWKTSMAPPGFSGNAVWGSSPAVDTKRSQVYVATGNNYSVPDEVLDCVDAAGDDPAAQQACLPADNHFDSVLALDMKTGAVKWATRALGFDAWTVDCFPFLGDGSNCPDPAGPDFDFGQAPALFSVSTGSGGKTADVVGAGQKSGQYWAIDPDSGSVIWVTQAGPGGTAGGLQWGSAVDSQRVYTANANSAASPWTLPGGSTTTAGVWSALDNATGQVLWQIAPPNGGGASGPVTTTNGVVFGCSLDPQGHMYAIDGSSGTVLWSFASGGSCLSGAAISNNTVFWGSGYSNFGFGTPNNKVYAFGL